MNNPTNLTVQYADDHDLQVRIATHSKYTVSANLETLVDRALGLSGDESLLDVGTGPGDFPARVRTSDSCHTVYGISESDWARGRVGVQREFEQRCEHGPWRVSKQVAIITARA